MEIPTNVSNIFEITAAHFAHVFYNEMYAQAKSVFTSQGHSITEAYKSILVHYLKHMKSDQTKWFTNTITHIKIKFDQFTNIRILTQAECINKIAEAFIPEDFISSIPPSKKMGLVHKCVSSATIEIINDIASNHLPMIVDDHQNRDNITTIKDIFVGFMAMQREQLFTKFLEDQSGDSRINTDVATAKRLRRCLKLNIKELRDARGEYEVLLEKYNTSISDLNSHRKQINTLRSNNTDLSETNATFKSKIVQLIDEMRKIKSQRSHLMGLHSPNPHMGFNVDVQPQNPSMDFNVDVQSPNPHMDFNVDVQSPTPLSDASESPMDFNEDSHPPTPLLETPTSFNVNVKSEEISSSLQELLTIDGESDESDESGSDDI
jgi:hypothetical protein